MNKWRHTSMTRIVLLLLLSVLASCDGGIFGTGDGSDIAPVNTNDIAAESPMDTPDGDSSMSTENMPASPDGVPSPDEQAMDAVGDESAMAFDNLMPVDNVTDAELRIVNVSARDLSVSIENAMFAAPRMLEIAAGGVDVFTPLPTTSPSVLRVIGNGSSSPATRTIDPLTVGDSTVTTLVIRDTTNSFDILPLVTATSSSGAGLARVRLIQGGTLGNTATLATFTLQPAGDNPGGSETVFPDISFVTRDNDYQEVLAGDYVLIDSAGRFTSQDVSFIDGEVYTVLIINTAEPVLRIITDSDMREP